MARKSQPADLDMTPMIDVVFQLIIFFVVTITIQQEYNRTIELQDGPHGPEIKGDDQEKAFIIEIDRNGWVSMHNAQVSDKTLYSLLKNRYKRHGEFPILIRGDRRASHKSIRKVMDICTSVGLWRINFVVMKEKKRKRR